MMLGHGLVVHQVTLSLVSRVKFLCEIRGIELLKSSATVIVTVIVVVIVIVIVIVVVIVLVTEYYHTSEKLDTPAPVSSINSVHQ